MSLTINCPNCQYKFEPGGAFMKDYEAQARQKMIAEWQRMKMELDRDKAAIFQQKEMLAKQKDQQEQEVQQRLLREKQKLQQELQESIRKAVASDYETKVKMLEQSCEENSEKLKEAHLKELNY